MTRTLSGAIVGALVLLSLGCGSDKNSDGSFGNAGSNGTAGTAGDNGGGVIVTTGGGVAGDSAGTASTTGGVNTGQSCNGMLTGVLRDFHTAFPDMEVQSHDSSKCYCDDK